MDISQIKTTADFDAINDPSTKLAVWNTLKADLERVKELEMHARKSIVPIYFPDPKNIEGTQNFDLGNDYKLKVVKKLNYRMAANDKVTAALDAIAEIGDEGKFIAERLVSYDPRLSVSEYKALDPANPVHKKIKATIDGVVTIAEGSPELTIIEPKAKA
jgi:hypothetical protein